MCDNRLTLLILQVQYSHEATAKRVPGHPLVLVPGSLPGRLVSTPVLENVEVGGDNDDDDDDDDDDNNDEDGNDEGKQKPSGGGVILVPRAER